MTLPVVVVQHQLIAAMTAERKLEISEGLRRTAWDLKAAWIAAQHPELSAAEVRAAVRQLFTNVGA